MRVALVTLHTSPLDAPATGDAGGMNVVVFELARTLASLGHSVTLISAGHPSDLVRSDLPENISLIALSQPGESVARKNDLPEQFSHYAERLAAHLSNFDVIHSHYWLSAEVVKRAISLREAGGEISPPHLASFHTLGAQKISIGASTESPLRVDVERSIAKTVALLAGSNAEAKALQEHYGVDARRISVVSPGVDTDAFSPAATTRAPVVSETAAPDDPKLLLAVIGRIQEFKGQDFALDVFARVYEQLRARSDDRAVELVFAGEATPGDDTFLRHLHDRVSTLGVPENVRFVGALNREDTAALLATSTLTLIASRSETFGLVALESAACGTPVIAQRVGGLTESVSDGVSGMLMPSRDPDDWARVIVSLADDETALERLRQGAREFASERSWLRVAEQYLSVYSSLMSSLR